MTENSNKTTFTLSCKLLQLANNSISNTTTHEYEPLAVVEAFTRCISQNEVVLSCTIIYSKEGLVRTWDSLSRFINDCYTDLGLIDISQREIGYNMLRLYKDLAMYKVTSPVKNRYEFVERILFCYEHDEDFCSEFSKYFGKHLDRFDDCFTVKVRDCTTLEDLKTVAEKVEDLIRNWTNSDNTILQYPEKHLDFCFMEDFYKALKNYISCIEGKAARKERYEKYLKLKAEFEDLEE